MSLIPGKILAKVNKKFNYLNADPILYGTTAKERLKINPPKVYSNMDLYWTMWRQLDDLGLTTEQKEQEIDSVFVAIHDDIVALVNTSLTLDYMVPNPNGPGEVPVTGLLPGPEEINEIINIVLEDYRIYITNKHAQRAMLSSGEPPIATRVQKLEPNDKIEVPIATPYKKPTLYVSEDEVRLADNTAQENAIDAIFQGHQNEALREIKEELIDFVLHRIFEQPGDIIPLDYINGIKSQLRSQYGSNRIFDSIDLNEIIEDAIIRAREISGRQIVRGSGRGRKSSPWISFVKQVQNKYGCSYKEALTIASKLRKK